MKVGLSLPQRPQDGPADWPGIRGLARLAEDGGADSLWVADHFLDRRPDEESGLHEPFGLLTAVAAVTSRVELGPLVAATSFRSPGLLAKVAATLDLVAEGRLTLGVGCGWHEPEYQAFGYPFDHRVGRFEESIRVIRALLDGERVTFHGRWVTADDAVLLPAPTRRIALLIAAEGPRMLRLAARHADAWQAAWPQGSSFDEALDRLAAACELEDRATMPEVFIDIEVGGEPGAFYVPPEPAAIEDALAGWAERGVAHVQVGTWPAGPESWEPVLEGIRRFRAAAGPG